MRLLFFLFSVLVMLQGTIFSQNNHKHMVQVQDLKFKIYRGAQNGAAYVNITNGHEYPITLYKIEIDSEAFEKIELHDHIQKENADGGKYMEMITIPEMEIAPGETLSLQPGTKHIMLMGVKNKFCEFDKQKFTFFFRGDNREFDISVEIDIPEAFRCDKSSIGK